MPKRSEIFQWIFDNYIASLSIDSIEGSSEYKQFIDTIKNIEIPLLTQGLIRINNFIQLKYNFPLKYDGYVVSVFSLIDGENSTNFAYGYWNKDNLDTIPEYLCIANTFESKDGEYRSKMFNSKYFIDWYDNVFTEHFPTLEPFAISLLNEIKVRIYPEENMENIGELIINNRYHIKFLAVAILFYYSVQLNHITTSYKLIFDKIKKKLPKLSKEEEKLRTHILNKLLNYSATERTKCGQKLVPMYYNEVINVYDFNFPAWRELHITKMVSDLTINQICMNFPIFNQWTYIEGTDRYIFENISMHNKFKRAQVVDSSYESLREARRRLENMQDYFVNELNAHIYENIEYAQNKLLLSNITLMYSMEDSGFTFGSMKEFLHENILTVEKLYMIPENTIRVMFELVYAVHCLHVKCGIIHSDLHTNNMTFNRTVGCRFNSSKVDLFEDPVNIFITGERGEADTYILPAHSGVPVIIDFSRCILGPKFRVHLESKFNAQYATTFYRNQINTIMKLLFRFNSQYVTMHQDKIKAVLMSDFSLIFPVICLVDYISIGSNFSSIFTELKQIVPEIKEDIILLGNQLELYARELLIKGLHNIIENIESKDKRYPGMLIFEKIFAEWKYSRWITKKTERFKNIKVVGLVNINNEVKYSGNNYSTYPKSARIEEMEKHLGEYKIKDIIHGDIETFFSSFKLNPRIEVITDRVRLIQERLNGKSVASESSWIN